MRIQHNIIAMNAYRNYNNNTSAISKNLEKLSSGYKINRAGDDAAGLAVSQKMRLQIAGLAQAQKNAKSGISYIQTAEGALQEVHEMLERMYTLAEQSANGTFDDSTDRVQLQKEVNSLMEEIDRIGKTANFNGMGIFAQYQGGAAGGAGGAGDLAAADITAPTAATVTEATVGSGSAAAVYSFDLAGVKFAKDGTVSVGLAGKTYDVAVTKDMTADAFATALVAEINKTKPTSTATGDFTAAVDATTKSKITLTAAKQAADTEKATMTKAITITPKAAAGGTGGTGGTNTLTAAATLPDGVSDVKATDATKLAAGDVKVKVEDVTGATATKASFEVELSGVTGVENGKNYKLTIDSVDIESDNAGGTAATDLASAFDGKTATIGGVNYTISATGSKIKFEATAAGAATALADNTAVTLAKGTTSVPTSDPSATGLKTAGKSDGKAAVQAGKNVTITNGTNTDTVNFAAAAWTGTVEVNSTKLGVSFKYDTTKTGLNAEKTIGTVTAAGGNGGGTPGTVSFWIGAEYNVDNQLTISGMNLSTTNMSVTEPTYNSATATAVTGSTGTLQGVTITDANSAMASLQTIKDASDAVSNMRGTLGAMQNRLDHTLKNLSVMQENMQDAESVIRDTDVAEEMMAYTKNNILIQSAQAMLAQANQIPQGVLQLLQ